MSRADFIVIVLAAFSLSRGKKQTKLQVGGDWAVGVILRGKYERVHVCGEYVRNCGAFFLFSAISRVSRNELLELSEVEVMV